MAQLIDKSALVAEIKRILSAFENSDAPVDRLRASILIRLLSFIDTLEVKEVEEYEQPEHSCFEYKCGKKPYWNIGDTLAYYEFCSDREGEHVLGKVANVKFDDEEQSDWIYTFENGSIYDEESLLEDNIYKKK